MMKAMTIGAILALAIGIVPLAAQAQGIARGAQDGAQTGHRAAGPVGGVVGGVVGGAVGGAVGGVKGVLGIPQESGYRHRRAVRHHRRYR